MIYELVTTLVGDLTPEKFIRILLAISIGFGFLAVFEWSRQADRNVRIYYANKYQELREAKRSER